MNRITLRTLQQETLLDHLIQTMNQYYGSNEDTSPRSFLSVTLAALAAMDNVAIPSAIGKEKDYSINKHNARLETILTHFDLSPINQAHIFVAQCYSSILHFVRTRDEVDFMLGKLHDRLSEALRSYWEFPYHRGSLQENEVIAFGGKAIDEVPINELKNAERAMDHYAELFYMVASEEIT